MSRLQSWIEDRFNIVFGTVVAGRPGDHRLLLRIGGGKGSSLADLEFSIFGRGAYLTRVPAGRERIKTTKVSTPGISVADLYKMVVNAR